MIPSTRTKCDYLGDGEHYAAIGGARSSQDGLDW